MSVSITELFVLNQETMMVELNKEWISTIKEFRALLMRDKGSKGDSDGRKKLQAQREFTFIYHYIDYRSNFVNYGEGDRMTQALKNADLDTNLNILKDNPLITAIEVYRVLQDTAAVKLLTELKEGVHTGYKVARKVRQDLEKELDKVDDQEPEYKEVKGRLVLIDPIVKITERLKVIMDLASELPKTLSSIKELEEEVKRELANVPNLKGKAQKGENEDKSKVSLGNPFAL